jgi:hypothetical protein
MRRWAGSGVDAAGVEDSVGPGGDATGVSSAVGGSAIAGRRRSVSDGGRQCKALLDLPGDLIDIK